MGIDDNNYNGGNPLALPKDFLLANRYRIGNVLGAGGFGITYKAEDRQTGRVCAIKEYVPLGLVYRKEDSGFLAATSADNWEPFSHGKVRFSEEANILLELGDIPGVVKVYDSFEALGTSYYVMEYLDGMNVRQLQKVFPNWQIPLSDAVYVILRSGEILDKVHKNKHMLHRDISPDNLFYTKSGEVKVIDFGNAKHLSQNQRNVFSVLLKPGFAPPEQHSEKQEQGPYTDEYSLAATFYCIVGGKAPLDARDRLVGGDLIPLNELNTAVSPKLWEVLRKALSIKYENRYKSVGDFITALSNAYSNDERAETNIVNDAYVAKSKDTSGALSGYVQKNGTTEERRPFLLVYISNTNSRKWYLPADTDIKIGRSQESTIVIRGCPEISRHHLTLLYDSKINSFFVLDNSTYGTKADNQILKKGIVYKVPCGCILTLANKVGIMLGTEHG